MKKIKNELIKPTTEIVDELPFATVAERLKTLFKDCVGKENAVYMPQIYEHIYGSKQVTKLQYMFRCQKICYVMNFLRKRTFFFIIGEYINHNYVWYVVKTKEEALAYKKGINEKIAGLEYMKQRCDNAVNLLFYKRLK